MSEYILNLSSWIWVTLLNMVEGKWIDLEKSILSDVTQTKKDTYNMYSFIVAFNIKQRKTSLQVTTPEKLDNKEDPKRDIYGST